MNHVVRVGVFEINEPFELALSLAWKSAALLLNELRLLVLVAMLLLLLSTSSFCESQRLELFLPNLLLISTTDYSRQ